MNIMNKVFLSLIYFIVVVSGTYLLASSFFRHDLKEEARSTDL